MFSGLPCWTRQRKKIRCNEVRRDEDEEMGVNIGGVPEQVGIYIIALDVAEYFALYDCEHLFPSFPGYFSEACPAVDWNRSWMRQVVF